MTITIRGGCPSKENEKGFLLISLYLLLPLLLIVAGAMMSYAGGDIQANLRTQAFTQAFYCAEAGVDSAIVQLRKTGNWVDSTAGTPVGSYGSYSVVAADAGSNHLRLSSTGSSSYLGNPISQAVEAIVEVIPTQFVNGAFGNQSVTMTDNVVTDSFVSSTGTYSPGTAGAKGNVGTNGQIALSGSAKITGDAVVAPKADPNVNVTIAGSAQVTGTLKAADKATTLRNPVIPPNIQGSGPLTLSGNTTLTLSGGTYAYDSITISGAAQLKFTGPTTLYVSSLQLSGNSIITAGDLPPNLLIYVTGTSAAASGNAKLYGGIYGAEAAVTLSGNAALFGAVMAKTVTMTGNGNVHYDEVIKDLALSQWGVNILSWGIEGDVNAPTPDVAATYAL